MKLKAKSLVALAAVIVALELSDCAGSQPAASLGGVSLTGVWKCDECPDFLQLNEDGTYAVAPIKPDFLEKAPADKGEFRLEGASFTFISSNESFICASQAGSYQVELTELGQLRFELEEDACQERASFYPGTWSRYEP